MLGKFASSTFLLGASICFLAAPCAVAQKTDPETVVSGLSHPCGVAIHPDTGMVYVSDSGHGKVVRVTEGVAEDVVTGFSVAELGNEFGFAAGPLGIGFFGDKRLLVVGSGGWNDGEDRVDLFELNDTPLTVDDAKFTAKPESDSGSSHEDFFGVATTFTSVWIAGRDDPDYGWVSRITQEKPDSIKFVRTIDTWKATETRLPTALTVSPDGFVVVGQHGENGNPSTLAFYDQTTGDVRAKFDLGQHGIVALAYGPQAGKLFALFHSRQEPGKNGLYKLVARKRNTACEAQLVQKIADPWAMAFASNGDLYIAAGREDGSLLKISGLDRSRASDSSD